MAKVIQVILTDESRGTGKVDNPYRIVPQYWNFKGELLAEVDDFDPHVSQILSLNNRLGRVVAEKETLASLLKQVTAIQSGKRVMRINKARELVTEALENLKTPYEIHS